MAMAPRTVALGVFLLLAIGCAQAGIACERRGDKDQCWQGEDCTWCWNKTSAVKSGCYLESDAQELPEDDYYCGEEINGNATKPKTCRDALNKADCRLAEGDCSWCSNVQYPSGAFCIDASETAQVPPGVFKCDLDEDEKADSAVTVDTPELATELEAADDDTTRQCRDALSEKACFNVTGDCSWCAVAQYPAAKFCLATREIAYIPPGQFICKDRPPKPTTTPSPTRAPAPAPTKEPDADAPAPSDDKKAQLLSSLSVSSPLARILLRSAAPDDCNAAGSEADCPATCQWCQNGAGGPSKGGCFSQRVAPFLTQGGIACRTPGFVEQKGANGAGFGAPQGGGQQGGYDWNQWMDFSKFMPGAKKEGQGSSLGGFSSFMPGGDKGKGSGFSGFMPGGDKGTGFSGFMPGGNKQEQQSTVPKQGSTWLKNSAKLGGRRAGNFMPKDTTGQAYLGAGNPAGGYIPNQGGSGYIPGGDQGGSGYIPGGGQGGSGYIPGGGSGYIPGGDKGGSGYIPGGGGGDQGGSGYIPDWSNGSYIPHGAVPGSGDQGGSGYIPGGDQGGSGYIPGGGSGYIPGGDKGGPGSAPGGGQGGSGYIPDWQNRSYIPHGAIPGSGDQGGSGYIPGGKDAPSADAPSAGKKDVPSASIAVE